MKLHTMNLAETRTERNRVGRGPGSGNGKTSGRGQKGQKSRSGLIEAGIINKELSGLKVLGNGELTKKLTVEAVKFSKSAKEAIEKAGGKVEVL